MGEKTIPAPAGYPYFGWTPEKVRAHLIANPLRVGDTVILHNGHGGMHRYQLVKVVNPAGAMKRVIVSRPGDSGGTSFNRTGINAHSPRGKTRLLPLIPELVAHLTLERDVRLDVPLYA